MNERGKIEERIRVHLERVEAAVRGSADERAEIRDNVDGHIRAALAARGTDVTVEDLEAVLAEMDPPESYGEHVDSGRPPETGRSPAPAGARNLLRGCLVAAGVVIVGLMILPIGYLMLAYVPASDGRPVVEATVPVHGDRQVDPGLSEIRVTFDRPMLTDRMWSWCLESEETWPALDPDGVRYVDDRTCVAPVRLEPGRTYVIWFNTEHQDAFRDTHHRPAVPYRLEFATADGEAGGS